MEKLLKELSEIEKNTKCENCKQDTAYIRLQCVRVLQQISEKLLTEYYIQFGDFKIEPLRVEAYYFHEKTFEDCTTYGRPRQQEYDRLFLHGSKVGYEGVDICIGNGQEKNNGNRYLSFLIKDAIVTDENGEAYCKQTALYNKLKQVEGFVESEKSVLKKKPKMKVNVFHTVRKGLSGKPFGRELLGALIPIEEKQIKMEFIVGKDNNKEYLVETKDIILKGIAFYDFEAGFGAGQTIAQYLRENPEKNNEDNWNFWWDGGFPGWAKNWDEELKKRRGNG